MNDKSESKILDGFLSGDVDVLNTLYLQHFPKIKHHIVKNSGTESEAKDVFQDALVLTYQKLKSGSLRLQCSLATYIFAVSKNLWMNTLRKRRRMATMVPSEVSVDTDNDILGQIHQKEKELLYQKHFLNLGESCQRLLRLFFENKSMSEISKLMDYSEGYTRKKKFLCKKQLLDRLEKDPTFNELSNNPKRDLENE